MGRESRLGDEALTRARCLASCCAWALRPSVHGQLFRRLRLLFSSAFECYQERDASGRVQTPAFQFWIASMLKVSMLGAWWAFQHHRASLVMVRCCPMCLEEHYEMWPLQWMTSSCAFFNRRRCMRRSTGDEAGET